MVCEIRRILYATDFSEDADYAFEYVVSLSMAYHAPIIILHSLEDLAASTLSLVRNLIGEDHWHHIKKENEDQMVAATKAKLVQLCEKSRKKWPERPFVVEDIIVDIGHPVDRIIAVADSRECDIIVMGARGKNPMAEASQGSTSRRVLRRARKPILTIHPPVNSEKA